MSKHSKSVWKNWKLLLIVAVVSIVIIVGLSILVLRNKMTSEETVSRFMYLIENKQYEEAKKLCSGKLEKLDILSNIEPSNLTFDFSEDKKNATAVLLEDSETAEITNLYVVLNNSILGWKIKEYEVVTDLIPQSILQKRLENGKKISESEFLRWAIDDETEVEDISKYAENNLIILTLFADFMKKGKIEKAFELYKPINSELYDAKELTEEEIKAFDWNNYNIYNSTEFYGINTYMINSYDKKINVIININHTIAHIYQSNL